MELLCRIFACVGSFRDIRLGCAPVSRRWRALCKCVGVLHLECGLLRFKVRPFSERLFILEALIGKIVVNVGGEVTRFVISGPNFSFGALGAWLNKLSGSLEFLSIENEIGYSETALLAGDRLLEILNCQKLKQLELTNWLLNSQCIVEGLHGRTCFLNLVSCRLSNVVMTDGTLEDFLKLCPALSSLTLASCEGFESPSISSNVLKELEFEYVSYGPEFQKCLKNLTITSQSLKTINMFGVSKLTGALPTLRKVTLNSGCQIQATVQTLHSFTIRSATSFRWSIGSVLSTLAAIGNLDVRQISVTPNVEGRAKMVFTPMFKCFGH